MKTIHLFHRKHEPTFSYATTTTMSVLKPLSRLAGVGNFCFKLLSPFRSIVCILSSQAISFQIILYALFPQFPWSTSFLYPVISSSITSRIWELMSRRMTWPYHRRRFCIIVSLIFTTTPTHLSHPIHHPDHTTLQPSKARLIRNSKFPRFKTVQQHWSNTTLINLPPLVQR